jgi:hypothetical protein
MLLLITLPSEPMPMRRIDMPMPLVVLKSAVACDDVIEGAHVSLMPKPSMVWSV